jgi:hypothetical protein
MKGRSEELLELFNRQTSVTSYATHCKSIDRIVSRYRENTNPIRHDNVLSLPDDLKAGFL